MLFGIYVVFHGHFSPGGGFQGGAMLAASIILIRIITEKKLYQSHFKINMGIPIGALGVFIFLGVGLIAMLFGGYYLDYKFLPIPNLTEVDLRYYGILFVEIGVGVAVMSILVSIYDSLLEEDDD